MSMRAPSIADVLPRATGCVVLETSKGPLTIDLFGRDAPLGVQAFANLCAVGYYTGARVTRIVPGNFLEIRQTLLDASSAEVEWTFDGLVTRDPAHRLPCESAWTAGAGFLIDDSGRRAQRPFPLARKGLVLLRCNEGAGAVASRVLITLSDKSVDFLRSEVTLIGVVIPDGSIGGDAAKASGAGGHHFDVLDKVARTATKEGPSGRPDAPVRLIRVKHVHLVADPCAGAGRKDDRDVDGERPDGPGGTTSTMRRAARAVLLEMFAASLRATQQRHEEECHRRKTLDDPAATLDMPWMPLVMAAAGSSGGQAETSGTSLLTVGVNPHYVASDCLSSDDDVDDEDRGNGAASALSMGSVAAINKEVIRARVDHTRALMLKVLQDQASLGDEVQPPENVLFVCKLNPVTTSEGLRAFFSQMGKVVACDVVRDWRTGDSLQYAFVEFATVAMCNRAFQKMNGALVDHCRIHVDFCQSVSGVWARRRRELAGGGSGDGVTRKSMKQ